MLTITKASICGGCHAVRAANGTPSRCSACRASFAPGYTPVGVLRLDVAVRGRHPDVSERIDFHGAWEAEARERALVALRTLEEPTEDRTRARPDLFDAENARGGATSCANRPGFARVFDLDDYRLTRERRPER